MRESASSASDTLRYAPIDPRRVLGNARDAAHRAVLVAWGGALALTIALGLGLRAVGVGGVPISVGAMQGRAAIDAPLLIFAPVALWFGWSWALVGAWLSGCVLLIGQVSLPLVPVVSLGHALALVALSAAFRVAPVSIGLRSPLTLPFFLIVALLSAMVGSTGNLVANLADDSASGARMLRWYESWPGTFLQTVLLVGPALWLYSERVAAWKARRGLGEPWSTPDRQLIAWTLVLGVGAMALLVIGDRATSRERISRLLSQAQDPAFVATADWSAAVREAAAPAATPLLSMLLLACVGLVAYELAQRWWGAMERSAQERAAAEARSRALLDAISDLVLHMKVDGTVLGHKDGLGLLGRSDVVGRSITSFWPSRITHPLLGRAEEAIARGSAVVEFRFATEKGLRDLEARLVALGRDEVMALVRDVSRPKVDPRNNRELARALTRDLRAPLTSVRGALGLLRGGAAEELGPKATQLIDVAWRNTERMVRLAEDIGDAQVRDGAGRTLKVENVDLGTLVEASVLEKRREAESFRLSLEVALLDDESRIKGDSDRIVGVMHILLANAIKFSPAHTRVKVALKRSSDVLRVEVIDEGQGIPETFQSRVFRHTPSNGDGRGLAEARDVVLALGGRIGFESKLGRGTTFWFELPEHAEDTEEVPLPDEIVRMRVVTG